MRRRRLGPVRTAEIHLAGNMLYAAYNAALGAWYASEWLICLAAYYIILSMLRFGAIRFSLGRRENSGFMLRFSGMLFLALALILASTTLLTLKYDTGRVYHEIIMITIAVYAFSKVSLSIVNYARTRRRHNPLLITLRSIAFADGAVSIFSLQRSMLVSFGEMRARDAAALNLFTGSAVCVLVVFLGIKMIRYERK